MTYACAIAPLDQSTTSLGWLPGQYVREPCPLPGMGMCGWTDNALQFLADPGTPVVAPFPVTVLSTSPFVLRPNIAQSSFFNGLPTDIRIEGVVPLVAARAALDKGALLGRIAAGQRGTKWALWDGSSPAQFILQMFRDVGLEPVGAARPDAEGFRLVPPFGGKLLARSSGPAGVGCTSTGMHGLGAYLGSSANYVAPAGFVDPSSGPYDRYGASSQTDTSVPRPRENVSPAAAEVGGGLVLLALGAMGAWLLSRPSFTNLSGPPKWLFKVEWVNPDTGSWEIYQTRLSQRAADRLARQVRDVLSPRWPPYRNAPTRVVPLMVSEMPTR